MSENFGRQTAAGHLTVSAASKEPYAKDVEATLRADFAEVMARYPERRSALLPMLHLVQAVDGYVTGRGIELCAELLDLTTAEVSGVATFYTQYKRHPNGEFTVGVCTNTLCAIMGGDEIWDAVSDHLGVGHDETTPDGRITLERIECNAACDYAPVVMTNWEFFDNQTPSSTIELVDALSAGQPVTPTRGPKQVGTFKQVSRLLAGFPDGRADEGVGAGPATLLGLRIAKEHGWTAPAGASCGSTESGSAVGAVGAVGAGDVGATPGSTETTPTGDEAATTHVEPAATGDAGAASPNERSKGGATRQKPNADPFVSTGDGVSGVASETESRADTVDVAPPQSADLDDPTERAAVVSAQSASVPLDQDATPGATLFDAAEPDDTTDGKGE